MKKILEKQLEAKVVKFCKSKNVIPYKFVSPSNRGVPDRLLIGPKGNIAFLELKREGEVPTGLQQRTLELLSKRGCYVGFVDTFEQAQKFVTNFICWDSIKG